MISFLRSFPTALFAAICAGLTAAPAATSEPAPRPRTTFPAAAQPRLALAGGNRVFLAYGHGADVFVVRSDDAGATFAAPVKVATVPGLMLGMRRGPRLVARGDTVTVTINQKDLLAFTSTDAGRTWSGPVTINDVPDSTREGLHDLALSPTGRAFVTWLDLRLGKTALFAAESADGGRTWTRNELLYRSPGGSICECCHPSASFNGKGDLAVMWRNSIEGARDMWMAVRPAGAPLFNPAAKLGDGTWNLKACPMDGGSLNSTLDAFGSVWMRDGSVYQSLPLSPERFLAKGKQPVACTNGPRYAVAWQQGADLWWSPSAGDTAPTLLARNARYATLVALADTDRFLVAYEQGPAKGPVSVVVERLLP